MHTNLQEASYIPNPSLLQLFDQMNPGIAQCNLEGLFTDVNDRYCEITGYTQAELRQTKMAMITHPDDRGDYLHHLQKCGSKGKNFIIHKRYIRKDGSEIWVNHSVSRMTGMDGSHFLTVISTDITDQVMASSELAASEARYRELAEQLEKQVLQRTAELRRSNDDLQQFAHVISHDLKEPVRRQKIFLERFLAMHGHLLPAAGLAELQKMEKGIDRIYSMIGSILHYSESVDRLPRMENVDLCELTEEVLSDLELLIEETGAIVHCHPLPTISGCRPLLCQLLVNLLSNSLKFRRPDVQPVIEIRGIKYDHAVDVEVIDNGIGFDMEDAEKIFETYTRLHSKTTYEGTGLGLALCRKIVSRHGGDIRAEGRPGAGTTIRIQLPLSQI